METNIQLLPATRAALPDIRRLYRAAFPPGERKPFPLLRRQQRRGCTEILAITDGTRFLGLMIAVLYRDMAMLDYFAVSPEARSGGVGHAALALLQRRYADKRLFLEIERLDPAAANSEQRARRKAFYLNNGMRESGVRLFVYGNAMELMHAGAPVDFQEYCALLKATLGPLYFRILHPREDR